MSGTALAIALTTADAAAGFAASASRTTSTVMAVRSRVVANLTISAAFAGLSAAGTRANASFIESILFVSEHKADQEVRNNPTNTNRVNFFIKFMAMLVRLVRLDPKRFRSAFPGCVLKRS